MINRIIKHSCGHSQEHKISENGRYRIIARLEDKLCSSCINSVIDLIKQGKKQEALDLKHKLEGFLQ